jgi:predicted nucleotidyltransferase
VVRLDELRAKREDILAITERYGAGDVRVFGSVLHGDAARDSDVDLLVDVTPRDFRAYMQMIRDLGALLGLHVDLATEKQLHRVIRDRVIREAVPL